MWVKKGNQPYVDTRSQHQKRLNVFGWVNPVNGLHGMLKWVKGNTDGFLEALRQIKNRFKGKVIDLWVDRASWHRGKRVEAFCMEYSQLQINYLPSYHPEEELNQKDAPKQKHRISLTRTLLIGLMITIIGAVGINCLQYVDDWRRQHKVHEMQDQIVNLEKKLSELEKVPKNHNSKLGFEILYRDKITKKQFVVDLWEQGRLKYRNYYDNSQIIARDTFLYEREEPIGKIREYIEKEAIVLVDKFTQAGVLKSKRHCKNGDRESCREYLRDFRSLLPPNVFAIYR